MRALRHLVASILVLLMAFSCVGCAAVADSNIQGDGDKPVVYASFYPIQYLVQEVAGDKVEVRSFLPRNQDPHLWEPTPRNIADVSKADVLFINGANMEKWRDQLEGTLPNLPIISLADGTDLISYKGEAAIGDFQYMTAFDYQAKVYPIEFGHTHNDSMRVAFYKDEDNLSEKELIKIGRRIMEDEGELVRQWDTFDVVSEKAFKLQMGHEYGGIYYRIPEPGRWIFFCDRVSTDVQSYVLQNTDGNLLPVDVLRTVSTTGVDKVTYDPHTWLSVRNVKKYVNEIETQLTERYPKNQRTFRRNASQITERLTDLDFEYRAKFKDLEFREFVVTHYAFAYLARDFDLVQYPLQSLTSMDAPSIKKIKEAIDFCNRNDVKTVFYEYGLEKKGADTIAEEVDGEAVPLISMEFTSREQQRSGMNYVDYMEMNLKNIYEALQMNG